MDRNYLIAESEAERELDELDVTADDVAQPRQIADRDAAGKFLLAGKATVTLKSQRTGAHFTFKVSHKQGGDVSFVSLLTGPNNETDYRYLGLLADTDHSRLRGVGSGKSCAQPDAPASRAFQYLLDFIGGKNNGTGLEVWHEGRCGRCGRKLTVPSSVESGIGPECASKIEAGSQTVQESRQPSRTEALREAHRRDLWNRARFGS